MIRNTIRSAINENFAMILIFTVVIVTLRLMYIFIHKEKFIFHKEMFYFIFLLYALLLFYVVTFQDVNYGTNNFIPFKEITRYEFGSKLFLKNTLGNVLLFLPYGIFVSFLLKTRKFYPIIIVSSITSLVIEYSQLKIGRTFDIDDIFLNIIGGFLGYLVYIILDSIYHHMPSFVRKTWFKNLLLLLIFIIIFIVYTNFSFWGILK